MKHPYLLLWQEQNQRANYTFEGVTFGWDGGANWKFLLMAALIRISSQVGGSFVNRWLLVPLKTGSNPLSGRPGWILTFTAERIPGQSLLIFLLRVQDCHRTSVRMGSDIGSGLGWRIDNYQVIQPSLLRSSMCTITCPANITVNSSAGYVALTLHYQQPLPAVFVAIAICPGIRILLPYRYHYRNSLYCCGSFLYIYCNCIWQNTACYYLSFRYYASEYSR